MLFDLSLMIEFVLGLAYHHLWRARVGIMTKIQTSVVPQHYEVEAQ